MSQIHLLKSSLIFNYIIYIKTLKVFYNYKNIVKKVKMFLQFIKNKIIDLQN